MKQKRKVKNLLSEKKSEKRVDKFSMTFLIALWWVFSLLTAWLATPSVWVTQEIKQIPYTWLNDKLEVLYNLSFIKPDNTKLNDLYLIGNSMYGKLYISSSKPIVVNPLEWSNFRPNNRVVGDVYSNILWWDDNEVSSNNLTIVGWKNNTVAGWNDNSTVLWWSGNKIKWSNSQSVLLWGSGNVIDRRTLPPRGRSSSR